MGGCHPNDLEEFAIMENRKMDWITLIILGFGMVIIVGTFMLPMIKTGAEQYEWDEVNERTKTRQLNQIAVAERKAVSEKVIESWNAAIPWFWGIASFTGVVLSLVAIYTFARTGHALTTKAEIWARSVSVDPRTGQLPAYMPRKGNVIADPNTGLVLPYGEGYRMDRQMAQGAQQIRALGVVSRNARSNGIPVEMPPLRVPELEQLQEKSEIIRKG
jgi:hypothetical protein